MHIPEFRYGFQNLHNFFGDSLAAAAGDLPGLKGVWFPSGRHLSVKLFILGKNITIKPSNETKKSGSCSEHIV
jgi:hypothetical protein